MTPRFEGKIVLVTGAASGIGRAAARLFAEEGAQLVLADRNLTGAEDAAHAIGGEAIAVAADISDFASCEAMVAAATRAFGGLDIAFNNAGIPSGIGGEFEDFAIEDWQRILSTNLSGVFYSIRAEVPALKARGGGSIVVTASIASLIAAPGMAAYVASKHGVGGLVKAAAIDLIKHNIRVNAICPGMVDTAMLAAATAIPEVLAGMKAATPIGRIATPEEAARAALFLASEEASYMVGALMAVDGGVSLQ
ncbi:SDR family NAD(P)-dependent oxidoreductase [Sphingomonas sp. MMS24-J13]|uniref:SDR family NAD(P)-dependent oxidoreductase n=1 Tax=Sphingomonas sp. MMS24-J13 TaxID=3238686 RepID=UPI00384D2FAA